MRARLWAGIKRALGSGPGAGALVLSLFFFVDLAGASIEFMGFSDAHAYDVILRRYGARIVIGQLEILALYAGVGAVFGAMGALLGRMWGRATTGTGRALRGAAAALGLHAYFLARSINHYPQLYSEALYDRGGWRRRLEVALTSVPVTVVDIALAAVLLLVIGPRLRLPRLRPRRAWWLAGVPALLVAAVVLHHGRSGSVEHPNVLVIAVDSLRADRVFSENAARFPALRQIAAHGARFKEAHVTVPRTFPSFVTLMTGRWPYHHGIRHMFPTAEQRHAIGPALPAALAQAGYRTIAISDYAGEIFSRTPMGFEKIAVPYFDMNTIIGQRGLQVHPNAMPYATSALGRRFFPAVEALPEHADPEVLADRALGEIDRGGKPYFLTVFFSTAHFPYAAPSPWYRKFADPKYDGPFRYQKPPLSTAKVGPADAAQIRALYDGAVAATDHAISRLLERIDDHTIVVLLADHGENLYDVDGRGMGHGDHLRGSATDHVPLVIVDPRHPPRDIDAIVRDVDLAPTLAALAGVPTPPADGVSLLPLMRGEKLDLHAFSETEFWFTTNGPGFEPDERLPYPGITGVTDLAPDDDIYLKPEWQDMVVAAKHRAIRTPEWKLLYRPTRRGVLWSLYDVVHDPKEEKDVAAEHPEVVEKLRAELIAWMTADGKTVMRGGFAVPR
jgi:arylsulfatase A-like enzyme